MHVAVQQFAGRDPQPSHFDWLPEFHYVRVSVGHRDAPAKR